MKKIMILCAMTLTSCNMLSTDGDISQIPENSIYEKGDIVYKINKVTYERYEINDTHGDVEVIYRNKYQKVIRINKFENLLPMIDNVKVCDNYLEYKNNMYIKYCMDPWEIENYYFLISDSSIVVNDFDHFSELHVSKIIKY